MKVVGAISTQYSSSRELDGSGHRDSESLSGQRDSSAWRPGPRLVWVPAASGLGGSWSYYRCLIDSLPLPLRLFFYRKERTNFTQGKARR